MEPDKQQGPFPGRKPQPSGSGPDPGDRGRLTAKLVIGLVVPFIAICLLIPLINDVEINILNVPFVFIWMFGWFILTSVCLAICWFGFDRHRADETLPDAKPDAPTC